MAGSRRRDARGKLNVRVAVVGAGIAGLAAAHRVITLRPDWHVEVHDAAGRVGGNIATSTVAGVDVDEAADAFLVRTPAALELCREVGLGDELVHPAPVAAGLWFEGAIHDIPRPNVLGVPLDPAALASSPLVGAGAVDALAADVAGRSPIVDPDDSVGRLLRARLGDEITERIVEPLLAGVYAAPVDDLSLTAVTPRFAAAATAPSFVGALADGLDAGAAGAPIFAAPRGGMQRLIDAVADRLGTRVILDSAVTSVVPDADGATVTIDGTEHRFDGCIVATPGHVTRSILVSPAANAFADDAVSVAFVTVALDPDHIGVDVGRSGLLVPAAAGRTVTACSWASSKWPHLGADPFLVRAAVGRADDDDVVGWPDDAIVDAVLADLGDIMALDGEPIEVRVSRWPRSFPRYRPGHTSRIAAAVEALASTRVQLAGAAVSGIGIPACVHGAQIAAARLATV